MTEAGKRGALFFDLDGTVRWCYSGICPNRPEEVRVYEEARLGLREAMRDGLELIAITNQGGVALGYMTEAAMHETIQRTQELLGVNFIYYAAIGAPGEDDRRKPAPAMIYEAAEAHNIDLTISTFVGDRDSDREAAAAAGVMYIDALLWRDGVAKRFPAQRR